MCRASRLWRGEPSADVVVFSVSCGLQEIFGDLTSVIREGGYESSLLLRNILGLVKADQVIPAGKITWLCTNGSANKLGKQPHLESIFVANDLDYLCLVNSPRLAKSPRIDIGKLLVQDPGVVDFEQLP